MDSQVCFYAMAENVIPNISMGQRLTFIDKDGQFE